METTPFRPTKAGLPPWLFFAIAIMLFQLPRTYDAIRLSIADDEVVAEQIHVSLAIARIEDPFQRFPIEVEPFPYNKELKAWLNKENQNAKQQKKALDEWLKSGASSPAPSLEASKFEYQKEFEAWTEKQLRAGERRKNSIREWLFEGAAAKFRRDGAAAILEIGRSRRIEDKLKSLLYASIEAKNNIFVSLLEELEEDDLREAARRESGADPAGADKVLLIGYLLEVNEDKQRAMSQAWARTPGAKQLELSQLGAGAGENSLEAWREKFQLIMIPPGILLELGILLLPLIAFWDLLFPQLRKRRVEREHDLVEHSGQFPEINEIQEFVSQHMPRLNIRINLVARGSAFVYPSGYRRPCLAIKNDLYKLWKGDREKAKEIILHELEHIRYGDYIFLGYGSLFPKFLKWIVYGAVAITLIDVVSGILFSLLSVGFEWNHQAKQAAVWGRMGIGLPMALIFLALSRIMTPIFGIWASEFNADYAAIQRAAMLHEAGSDGKRGGRHWWIGGLTHPPLALRVWLSRKDTWVRDVVRHLIFPSAYFVLLLVLILFGVFTKFAAGGVNLEGLVWLLGLARDNFVQWNWRFGEMAALILAWPYLAPHWERFFAGNCRTYARWDTGRSLAGLALAALGGLAYWVGPSA